MTPSENTGSTESSGYQSPVVTTSTVESSPPTEKMLPQSEVNRLVGSAKHEAAERARREVESRYQSQAQQSMGGIPQLSEDQIRKMVSEAADKKAQEMSNLQMQEYHKQQANAFAQDFAKKMESAKSRYDNFDKTFEGVDLGKYADIAVMASQFGDSTGDIMHELFANPTKLSNMVALSQRDQTLAMRAMQQIKDSIDQNSRASSFKSPKQPLSHIQPSNAGMGNGDLNNMSVGQLKSSSIFKA